MYADILSSILELHFPISHVVAQDYMNENLVLTNLEKPNQTTLIFIDMSEAPSMHGSIGCVLV